MVCDPEGLTDFDLLRAALVRKGSRRVFLYAFDLLELDGRDLRSSPWDDRRRALTKLLHKAGDGIRLSEHLATTDGNTLFRHACAMRLFARRAFHNRDRSRPPVPRPTEAEGLRAASVHYQMPKHHCLDIRAATMHTDVKRA